MIITFFLSLSLKNGTCFSPSTFQCTKITQWIRRFWWNVEKTREGMASCFCLQDSKIERRGAPQIRVLYALPRDQGRPDGLWKFRVQSFLTLNYNLLAPLCITYSVSSSFFFYRHPSSHLFICVRFEILILK